MKKNLVFILMLLCPVFCISQIIVKNDSLPANKYYNPIEQKVYSTEGEFKKYQNGKEIKKNGKGVKENALEQLVFLSSDAELKKSTSLEDLKDIIDKTNKIFEELFRASEKSGKIMIQFELKKDENIIRFAVRGDLDLDIMAEFEKRINNEEYPKSKDKPVKLQLVYKVNSYDD